MNKKLTTNGVLNELAGASAFFQSPAKGDLQQQTQPGSSARETSGESEQPTPTTMDQASHHATTPSSHRDTIKSGNHAAKQPMNPPATPQPNHAIKPPAMHAEDVPHMLMEVRKMVRQLGKEAATHRFTAEEKRAIADLVYTYHRQGYRTSENEITRIAVNWILLDFEERGEQSVLARMLELLHG